MIKSSKASSCRNSIERKEKLVTEIEDRPDKKIVIKPRPVAIKFPLKRKSVGTDETSMSEISTLPSIDKI